MDIKEFQKTYSLSRGQVERLIAKAKKNKNRFSIPEFGKFMIRRTGKAKTAKIEILADVEPEADEETLESITGRQRPGKPHLLPRWSELAALETDQLIKLRHVAQIEKLRESTEAGKRETRRLFMSEALEVIANCLSPLRKTIENLNLDTNQLEKLLSALNESLSALENEQKKSNDESRNF